MSHRRGTSGQGAKDGDPIALVILMYQFLILLFWFQSNTAINPIAGNTTIVASYATGWTGIRWLGLMMAPFAIFMIVKAFTGDGSVFSRGGDDDEE